MSQEDRIKIAHRIGADVAAKHAADVDRNARFPKESIEALKAERLLSALVPAELGGMGMSMTELTAICTALGQYCSATAMVFAMHQIQVACIVRHGLGSKFFRDYCQELVARQMLIGSVTSEVGVGGDTRSSICAVEVADGHFILNKDATTISYGAHSDDLLITCRRDPSAARSDQVLVLVRQGQFQLEQTSQWDTLGMRGTCSPGFKLTSRGPVEQIRMRIPQARPWCPTPTSSGPDCGWASRRTPWRKLPRSFAQRRAGIRVPLPRRLCDSRRSATRCNSCAPTCMT